MVSACKKGSYLYGLWMHPHKKFVILSEQMSQKLDSPDASLTFIKIANPQCHIKLTLIFVRCIHTYIYYRKHLSPLKVSRRKKHIVYSLISFEILTCFWRLLNLFKFLHLNHLIACITSPRPPSFIFCNLSNLTVLPFRIDRRL